MNRPFRYSDDLRPVSSLRRGSSHYYVHGTPEQLAPLLAHHGVAYDELDPSPLNPHNGLIKIWKLGELLDEFGD